MEKRLVKILKALAEYHDLTLGDLIEGIVLHAFEGKSPFNNDESLELIADLKRIYGLDLDAKASHRLSDMPAGVERSEWRGEIMTPVHRGTAAAGVAVPSAVVHSDE